MTAFGRAEASAGGLSASVELRSVNHRFLEIFIRMPRSHFALEEKAKKKIREKAARGRVEVNIKLIEADELRPFKVDKALAASYFEALKDLKRSLNIPGKIKISDILAQEGVVARLTDDKNPEKDWPVIEKALTEALASFLAMREAEGLNLFADFKKRLKTLSENIDTIAESALNQPALIKERLETRLCELMDEKKIVDEARLAQEAAMLADKADITEEIVRARSHIKQFLSLMNSSEPCGRSLNFLAQELHREFSTMGSKTSDAAQSHIIVAAKAEIEKIREQVQNTE